MHVCLLAICPCTDEQLNPNHRNDKWRFIKKPGNGAQETATVMNTRKKRTSRSENTSHLSIYKRSRISPSVMLYSKEFLLSYNNTYGTFGKGIIDLLGTKIRLFNHNPASFKNLCFQGWGRSRTSSFNVAVPMVTFIILRQQEPFRMTQKEHTNNNHSYNNYVL